MVSPLVTTTYTMTADGSAGNGTCSATVTLDYKPVARPSMIEIWDGFFYIKGGSVRILLKIMRRRILTYRGVLVLAAIVAAVLLLTFFHGGWLRAVKPAPQKSSYLFLLDFDYSCFRYSVEPNAPCQHQGLPK